MSGQSHSRRTLSNVFIVVGAAALLFVAGYFLWNQYQARQLRAKLQQTPAPVAVSTAAVPLSSGTNLVAEPSPVAVQATPTPTTEIIPTPSPTSTLQVQPTLVPTQLKGIERPTVQPTVAVIASPSAPAGPPVRIAIPDPAIGIDAPVVEMGWEAVQTKAGVETTWVIPNDQAGHHIDSAMLGQPGNLVISGHNNIFGRVFEPISLAWPGKAERVDDITERSDILNGRTIQLYNAAGQRFDYVITDFLRLKDTGVPLAQRIDNARYMRPTSDTRLTLVTCWPPWSNTHRLIVIAKPAGQS